MKYIWLLVDLDYYELPLAVANSASELARICGVTTSTIHSARSHAKATGQRCKYQMVESEEETDEERIS